MTLSAAKYERTYIQSRTKYLLHICTAIHKKRQILWNRYNERWYLSALWDDYVGCNFFFYGHLQIYHSETMKQMPNQESYNRLQFSYTIYWHFVYTILTELR